MSLLKTPAAWPTILLEHAPTGEEPFAGLRRAVRELGPAGTIAEVAASGLRGRGGGGYPTGEKWRAAAAAATVPGAKTPAVVVNAYGADPTSLTDRTLVAENATAVVEGAAIAAWAIGAEEAVIAVRTGETAAIAALEAAIAAAHAAGVLGLDPAGIASLAGHRPGSARRLEIEVRTVQGAYMLGEETVLIKALEGKRGQPEQRPPHPTEDGLWGAPTVVQNAQTAAAVAWILRHSAEGFRSVGTAEEPGTILVDVRGPAGAGVAEVPFGTTLRDIVKLVGGAGAAHQVKAVLVGGPSGGILPADQLSTPYTYQALRAAGAHVGSGSIVIADERACVVDLARLLTRFCADEACGKTIPCRIGTRRLAEIGERLSAGTSRARDLDLLVDLADDIIGSALCDHERLATLPLTSGLRYFRPELDAHLERGECPAGVCHPIALAGAAPAAPATTTTSAA
ncbi:MAG TPA: NADH-ubiquinone oxidoreductase-F iron-sulfur binding region domain-containing protein [Candidatus Limnocylindrales bacterium]|nr:NADH-ubiquinone oxidoreductase-F iron-sulfur binding region domain-containing protein [Candidatus Limnocylindrales bacterium]